MVGEKFENQNVYMKNEIEFTGFKLYMILLAVFLFGLFGCGPKDSRLEIYRVKQPYANVLKTKEPKCEYCLSLKKENLFDKPLITDTDIKTFNWKNQQIVLTDRGHEKINALEIPLSGLPVALVHNGQIIYGFWFWNMISSYGCDRVYTYPKFDFELKFGLPSSNRYGVDPRFDNRIKPFFE